MRKKLADYWWLFVLVGALGLLLGYGLFGQSFLSGGKGFGSDEYYPDYESASMVCEKAMIGLSSDVQSRYQLECGYKVEYSRNLSDERCFDDRNNPVCQYAWYKWFVDDTKGNGVIDSGAELQEQIDYFTQISLKYDYCPSRGLVRDFGLGACDVVVDTGVPPVDVLVNDSVNNPPVFSPVSGGSAIEDVGQPNYLLFWLVLAGVLLVGGLLLFFLGKKK